MGAMYWERALYRGKTAKFWTSDERYSLFFNEYLIDRVEVVVEKQKGGIKDEEVSQNLVSH